MTRAFGQRNRPGLRTDAVPAVPAFVAPGPAVSPLLAEILWTALVGLLAVALCAPFLRSVFWLGDEGVLLAGAERLLHGSRLYSDFFEFLPPGGFVITAAWLDVAGISLWSARILAMLVIVGIACFTYLSCRAVCSNRCYPAVVVLAWLVMTQGYWTEISHHWFTTLFSMIAAWAALREVEDPRPSLRRPLIAGLAGGAAAMVVPTRGALAMIAAALAFARTRDRRRHMIAYVLAGGIVPAALLLYVVAQGSLAAAFADVIVFPASQYAAFAAAPYGYFANLQNFPLIFFFPLVALLGLLTIVRDRSAASRDTRLSACIAFAAAGFIGCYPRPDLAHIGFAVPFGCPLLTYCAGRLTAGSLRRYPAAFAALAVLLCIPSIIAYWLIAQAALRADAVETPRGSVAFLDDVKAAKGLITTIAATPADDAVFFYPLMPLMSFLLGREQVSRYDVFTPGYTLPRQYKEACLAVAQQAAWTVIDRNWLQPEFLRKIFPGLRNPEREETKRFEEALRTGFGVARVYGPFELRHRDPGIEQIGCNRIPVD